MKVFGSSEGPLSGEEIEDIRGRAKSGSLSDLVKALLEPVLPQPSPPEGFDDRSWDALEF